MSRLNLAGLSAVLLFAAAGVAEAKQWKYAGMHPRSGQPGDGLCHIETTHVHTAAPLHADTLYRTRDNVHASRRRAERPVMPEGAGRAPVSDSGPVLITNRGTSSQPKTRLLPFLTDSRGCPPLGGCHVSGSASLWDAPTGERRGCCERR